MKGIVILAYGAVCYVLFFLSFLYAIAFIGDFIVPRTVDHGPLGAATQALAVDLALLGLFCRTAQRHGPARV